MADKTTMSGVETELCWGVCSFSPCGHDRYYQHGFGNVRHRDINRVYIDFQILECVECGATWTVDDWYPEDM